ncbi:hypothetical protein H310_06393 [Aphanomyces invadans]|uniref:Chromodomain-helicase-DNA-binding protein 1-like C-terminal domain-containing protein n=1 Tax=Aphanomyces invadans TaxID=157072 RepID=A0A024U898_9STRA|nr:hypothetical protein H310_06393 [Aphanomyces invadans]ETW01818.1 hypothetical protein H310_06393 [Aphanomyces invadans]|eukprot:XP_008869666.1 hypothetical protein H310_06393 [Aphanomyces invadans]
MATSSPDKIRKDSSDGSNSSDNSDDSSSSGDSSSSSSSDSDSDNDTAKEDNSNNQSLPLTNEEKESPCKPFDPNPTRAAARLKESTTTGLMALNTQKRDRRTIEQIQSDLRIKRGAAAANNASANRVVPRRPTPSTVSPAHPPLAESSAIPSLDMSVKPKGNTKTVKGRLESKLAGRGTGSRAKTIAKTTASTKSQPTTSVVTNISRSAIASMSSSQTTPPETSPTQTDLIEDPRSNSKVVRTIVKALQRYGDLMDGNLYREHQSTFCDEYKQPSFLVRAKLSFHLKVTEDTLASIAKEIIVQCDTAMAQKVENVKFADVDIKPNQFIDRLYENLKLRVAVQRAMAAAKFKPGVAPHVLATSPSASTLSDFGIDQMPIWKSAEDENGWNVEKDRALLVGVYIHGFSAWEEILSDNLLPLEKQRALKGSRLKTRAENLLKKLPAPSNVKVLNGGGSTMMDRAAERAKRKAEEPPSASPPPQPNPDSIRREHVQSRFGGKQLQLVTRTATASEDEEGEVRSDSDPSDNDTHPTPVSGQRYGGKDFRIPKPKKDSGKKTSKKAKDVKTAVPALLSAEQLEAKWGPKDRLKHIRTTLKKVRRIAAWAQCQSDDNVVLEKVAKYICEIGAGIDQVVVADGGDGVQSDELATCLWTHAATFTPFSAVQFERLYDDMACDAAAFQA